MKQKNTDTQEQAEILKKPARVKKTEALPKTPKVAKLPKVPKLSAKSNDKPKKEKNSGKNEPVVVEEQVLLTPVPEYSVPEFEPAKKPLSFSRVIPNDLVINALQKSEFHTPSEFMFEVLPAALRGSDTLVYQTKQPEGFLVSIIAGINKVLNGENEEDKKSGFKALLVFPIF